MSSGKQARQRRRMVKAMAAAGLETGLAEQLYDNQIEPQLRAEELQAEGLDIQTDFVDIRPDAEGFEVTCLGCGRTAKLPYELPAGKAAICPSCLRDRR